MKVYGQLEKAQFENTTADVASMPKGMITYRTDLNQAKVSNGTIFKFLIDEDSTQTLSNKTLASPSTTGAITLAQTTTPSAPSAGSTKFYTKSTDGKLYYMGSDGVEHAVGSGSGGGQGGKNYAPNEGNFDGGVLGYSAFNTSFVNNIPTTITLGSTKVAVTAETTNPLSPTGSLKFAITTAASSAGHGFITDVMTIDDADLARGFQASFDYLVKTGLANLDITGESTSTLEAWVYNVGLAKWYQLTNFRGISSGIADSLITSFVSELDKTSNKNQYRFALIVKNDPLGTAELLVDGFYFGRSGTAVTKAPSFFSIGGGASNLVSGVESTCIFTNVISDTNGSYNAGTGQLTITKSGFYKARVQIHSGTSVGATIIGRQFSAFIKVNSVKKSIHGMLVQNTNSSDNWFANAELPPMFLNVGDVIEAGGFQNIDSGTTMVTTNDSSLTNFSVEEINDMVSTANGLTAVFRMESPPSGTINTSANLVTYPTVSEDNLGGYNGAGGYVIKKPGYYNLAASFSILGNPVAGDYAYIAIRKNNVDVASNLTRAAVAGGNGTHTTSTAIDGVWCNVGDLIEVYSVCSYTSPSFGSTLSGGESFFSVVSSDSGAKPQISSTFIPRLFVYNGASDTLAGATTQKIKLDTFYSDDTNNCKQWFDPVLYRFTPKKAGIYNFKNGLFLTGTNNRSYAVIIKNGTELWASAPSGGITGDVGMNGGADIPMNGTTDYVELYGFTFGAAAGIPSSAVDVYMQARWVSDL